MPRQRLETLRIAGNRPGSSERQGYETIGRNLRQPPGMIPRPDSTSSVNERPTGMFSATMPRRSRLTD
jgi:hypothetical protein